MVVLRRTEVVVGGCGMDDAGVTRGCMVCIGSLGGKWTRLDWGVYNEKCAILELLFPTSTAIVLVYSKRYISSFAVTIPACSEQYHLSQVTVSY